MREDQHAERACGLDEARGGDRLAGRGRMTEPVTPYRARIRARVLARPPPPPRRGRPRPTPPRARPPLPVRLAFDDLGRCAVAVRLGFLLVRGDQLGEHAGERVDLVAAQLGAGGEVRPLLGEHALEAEHQAVLDLPAGRGRAASGLDLGEGVVERAPAGGAGREDLGRVFALPEEGLARPGFGSEGGGRQAVRRLRRCGRLLFDLLHGRSALRRCTCQKRRPRESPRRASFHEYIGRGRLAAPRPPKTAKGFWGCTS